MNMEELRDALVEADESLAIMNRYRILVNKLMKAKNEGEPFIPKTWLDIFAVPATTCEYTEEQYAKVLELREELLKLIGTLGYASEQANAFCLAE